MTLHGGKRDRVASKEPELATPTIDPEVKEAILEYLPYRDSNDTSPEAPVFVQLHKNGRRPTGEWFSKQVKKCAKIAGIKKKIKPYSFRKSGGTIIAQKNPILASKYLGHSSLKTTNDYYVCMNAEDRKKTTQYMRSTKKPTNVELMKEMIERYKDSQISEEQFIYFLKAFKEKEDRKNKSGRWNISYM